MATQSLTVNKVFRQDGKAYVNWSDGVQSEFNSVADAKEWARQVAEEKDLLRRLLLSRFFFLDPTASNPSLIEGRTITMTNQNNSMITVA